MPSSKLFEMLADLAKHPNKLQDFKDDPSGTMDDYGLNQEQKDLILSLVDDGKAHDLHKAIGDELHEHFSEGDVIFC